MLRHLDQVDIPPDAVEVGRIAEAWGIKGWFKVHAHSSAPEALFSSKRWFILPSGDGIAHESRGTLLRITEVKEHSGAVVAGSTDIADRDAAMALRGARIFIARSSFPTAGEDEYYWVDLIGLEVVNRAGCGLGVVIDLLTTSAQTVLILQYTVDGKPFERMIPFVKIYVDSVDLAARRITVDWQPDY
ncbi:MAG: ribosome maturation factor RimM [Burkholderiaceae bacterium]